MKKEPRPAWDEYFLSICKLVSKRSTCLRRKVGAVLVKDKRILATGYNGAPIHIKHCEETGCLREKLNIPSGERHELCLPSDEEVFTDEGYIPISEVKMGQRMLTHRGLYREVTKLFKRSYKGKLYYVEPWNLLPVALTPEHPVLAVRTQRCQFDARTLCKETCKSVNNAYCNKPYLHYKSEWIPVSELKEKDLVLLLFDNRYHSMEDLNFTFMADAPLNYYKVLEEKAKQKSYIDIQNKLNIWPSTAYNWVRGSAPRGHIVIYEGLLKHGSSPARNIPSKIKLTPQFLRLVGFYLAEGCSSLNQVSFSFHRKEKGFIKEIKTAMKDIFALDCYEDRRKNVHKLVYSSIILAKTFKGLFGENAYNKRLPHFLTRIEPERQRHILTAYAEGDGYKINDYITTVTTVSKHLAMQIVQILLKLDYLPIIDTDKSKYRGIDTGRNKYRIIWKNKFKIRYGYLKSNVLFSPIRKIWSKKYSGEVYNLEVRKDNSYITKSFIVHNCRGLHAEQNALLQAALHGVSAQGAKVYATSQPCIICAKMLINAGIKELVIAASYPDKMAKDFLKEAGIKIRVFKK